MRRSHSQNTVMTLTLPTCMHGEEAGQGHICCYSTVADAATTTAAAAATAAPPLLLLCLRTTQFVLLEGVGHCPQDDKPELLHKELLPWLKARWGSTTNTAAAAASS